mgnify:CR=1 FL=1
MQSIWERPGFLVRRLHQIHVALFLANVADGEVTPIQYGLLSILMQRPNIDQFTIGEELGLAGVMVVIVLFYWLVKRGFEIGRDLTAANANPAKQVQVTFRESAKPDAVDAVLRGTLTPVSGPLLGRHALAQLPLGALPASWKSLIAGNAQLEAWAGDIDRQIADGTDGTLPTLTFRLGELDVQAREVEIIKRDSKPIDWASDAPEVIGTIGTDFIDARVVTMDFKGGKVQFGNARAGLGDLKFTPFKFQGRRLLLPANFEGKQIEVMYDSGSSAFAWLTSEDEFTRLATPGATVQSYPIRSWDKMVTAFTAPTSAQVTIGTTRFPIGEISRIDSG